MKKQFAIQVSIVALFATLTFGQFAPSTDLDGNWIGTLEVSGTKLRLAFKVSKTSDGFKAKFDRTDQGVTDLDIDSVTRAN